MTGPMRLDAAIDEAFGPGKDVAPKDWGRDLGNALIGQVMNTLAEEAPKRILGGSGEGEHRGGLEGLIQTAQQIQALQTLFGGGGGGGGQWQDGTMGAMAKMFEAMNSAQVNLTKTMMEMQSKADERNQALIAKMDERMREEMRELRDRKSGGGEDGELLRAIAIETIKGNMNQNPFETVRQVKEALRPEFEREMGGGHPASVIELEKYKIDKELEIEEKREARELARENNRNEMLGKGIGALSALAFGQRPPEDAPDGTPPSPGDGAGFFPYRCSACGLKFNLTEPRQEMTCPGCGTHLQALAPGASVPPEAITPPPGSPPPGPAAHYAGSMDMNDVGGY